MAVTIEFLNDCIKVINPIGKWGNILITVTVFAQAFEPSSSYVNQPQFKIIDRCGLTALSNLENVVHSASRLVTEWFSFA